MVTLARVCGDVLLLCDCSPRPSGGGFRPSGHGSSMLCNRFASLGGLGALVLSVDYSALPGKGPVLFGDG